jgi:nucleotide-binding universal stress UspA family protein
MDTTWEYAYLDADDLNAVAWLSRFGGGATDAQRRIMKENARRPSVGNVVVATDFSQTDAVGRALLLPISPGSSVTLLHVLPPDLPSPLDESFRRAAERLLGHIAAGAESSLRAAGRPDVHVSTSLVVGKPVAAICAQAHDLRAQLVVVGRTGASRRGGTIGGTAERVARACAVPVLVVASPPKGTYRRPLVAVDGGEPAAALVEATVGLVSPEVRTVMIAHAYDVPELSTLRLLDLLNDEVADLREEYASRARRHIKELVPTLPARIDYEPIVLPGDPRRVLVAEAARRAADLVVVGTRGHGAVLRFLLGSVAEAVIRDVTSDVLVVR